MRKQGLLFLSFFAAFPASVVAQDDAAQQAAQAARQAQRDADDAARSLQPSPYAAAIVKPNFSVKAGEYKSPITVRLKTATRGAIIYYTTDGWTPTALSNRYTGPITIDSTTTLQAIAMVPYYSRSLVSVAQYTLRSASPSAPEKPTVNPVPDASGKYTLARDTPVLLAFTSQVTSKNLEAGDKLPLALAEDLTLGNVVLAQKGTPVEAVVTEADGSRAGGAPGVITFVVHSFKVSNKTVFLRGTATKEGAP